MFEQITQFLQHTGYAGIVVLMFLENLFPPIPSELIMPLAGYEAAHGARSLPLTIAAGSCGSLLGALFWYYVGKRVGATRLKALAGRHGRWLTLAPKDIGRVDRWFDRNGGKAVLLGRLLPAVRTLISIPAGIFEMNLLRFILYSGLGSLIWTGLLAGAGFLLENQHETIAAYLSPFSNVITGLIVGGYIYRVVTWKGA